MAAGGVLLLAGAIGVLVALAAAETVKLGDEAPMLGELLGFDAARLATLRDRQVI